MSKFFYDVCRRMSKINNPFTFIKLSQATTVCFDKENALCDGELVIKQLVILDEKNNESEIAQIISNVLNAVNERNPIADALKKQYDFEQSANVKEVYSFDYQTRSMGATFKSGKTYIIGLIDNISIKNKESILKKCEEYFNQGQDVYVLAQSFIENLNDLDPVALIVTKEHIREEMKSAVQWLNDHNVDIKVVSNESLIKASNIAYDAGVKNVNRQVSVENMSYEDIKGNADKYVVFGDACREDKDIVIEALKNKGEKVIYINEDFDDFSKSLKESKRINNNLHRAALFLITKAILAVFLTIMLLIGYNTKAFDNPFGLYRYFVLDALIDIVTVVLLMIDKGRNEVKGKFLLNVLTISLPGAFMMFIAALAVFILYTMQRSGAVSFGIYNVDTAIAMSMIAFTILSVPVLYKICYPLNRYRRVIVVVIALIAIISLVTSAIISYTSHKADPLFGVPFMEMNGPTYLITTIIVIVLIGLYSALYQIFGKGEQYEN